MSPPTLRTRAGLALLLAIVAMISIAAPASARHKPPPDPPPSATWQIVDYQQSVCISNTVTTSYFGIWINGTWSRWIDVGIAELPSGGSYDTSYAPIAPGSSDGVISLAYVRVTINGYHQPGSATAQLWASDGVTRETVPVTIVFRDRCSDY